ncbi:MAG TPA: FxsA family protein [Pirellulales bacterium]|nr:FxsA family protein [Pirellulales bacterium]
MLIRLILLLTIVPLVELTLLLWLSDLTDWRVTLALVIGTGIAGSWLFRRQGWCIWGELQDDLRHGRTPVDSLQDGVLVLLAAALLVTPGILTDAVGLSLLVPAVRRRVRAYLGQKFKARFTFQAFGPGGATWTTERPDDNDEIIDVDSRPAPDGRLDHLPR